MMMKELNPFLKFDKSEEDRTLLTSEIAYGRLVGGVIGAFVGLSLMVMFSGVLFTALSMDMLPAVPIFPLCIFLGGALGKIFAVRRIKKAIDLKPMHLIALSDMLQRLVPSENVQEAISIIIDLKPKPYLIEDPIWVNSKIPAQLRIVKKLSDKENTESSNKIVLELKKGDDEDE